MTETFHYAGSTPSPDESIDFSLETEHHNWFFAVLLAQSIGFIDPLVKRIRDPGLPKTREELEFIAKVWANVIKLPTAGGPRRIKKHRRELCIAACYIEFLKGEEPSEGQITNAEKDAAEKAPQKLAALGLNPDERYILDTREVRTARASAKQLRYSSWTWWEIATRLARKGKLEQLHRTY